MSSFMFLSSVREYNHLSCVNAENGAGKERKKLLQGTRNLLDFSLSLRFFSLSDLTNNTFLSRVS